MVFDSGTCSTHQTCWCTVNSLSINIAHVSLGECATVADSCRAEEKNSKAEKGAAEINSYSSRFSSGNYFTTSAAAKMLF